MGQGRDPKKVAEGQAPQGRLFLGVAMRTLEAGANSAGWEPFPYGEHVAPTPTLLFGRQGVRYAVAKKIILARRSPSAGLRYFFRPAP